MKQILISLACCLSTIISFAQGQTNDALYIYRNDGKFNAFYYSEIDSITTSKLDESGNEYDEYKSQIVWTQDSVYWIPLEAIDSVSLCKQENKLASGVLRIDELLPYITDVDSMSFKLSASTPSGLIPKIGDILLYESFNDERFPLGFAGRVSSINNLTILCDSVNFEDIYDKYVCFGDYAAIEEVDEKGTVRKKLSPRRIEGNVSAGIDISGTASSAGFYATLKGSLTFNLRIIYKFEKEKPAYFQLSLSPKAKMMIESGVKGKFKHDFLTEAFNIGIPIPDTPFLLGLKGGPSISMALEASVTAKTEGKISSDMGLVYENGRISPFFKNTSHGFSAPDISGNINGSLFAGLHIDFGIYSYGGIISAVIEKEAGAEFVMNMSDDLVDLISKTDNELNTTKYDALHNVKIDFNLKGSLGGKAELKLGKLVKLSSKLTIGTFNMNLNTWKLLPCFTTPQIDMVTQSKATVSVVPEDKLLPPGVDIGLGIWDKSQYMDFHACIETYRVFNEWPLERFQTTFEGLEAGHEYEVFPLVWWKGIDMKATPSTPFMTKFPTPAKVKNFEVNNASFTRDGFEYKDKTYYYDFAATTTVELEDSEGIEDWGYVYKDPDGEKVHISVKDLGTNADSRYDYYRTIPKSTVTLYGYAKYGDDRYAYEEPKTYDLIYTFHPTAYVGNVITDSLTSTSAQFEYGFDDVPRTAKCFTAIQSARDNEPIVQDVSYAEKDTIRFSDLFPGTAYEYWAYVEYAGMTYISDKKSFTTLTPKANVEKADDDKVTMSSAKIGYGFANVPENAKCYVGISAKVQTIAGDGEEINKSYSQTFPVENTTGATYEFNGLYPSTTYTYYAYIEYEGETWYSGDEKFITKAPPTPFATTGDCSKVTTNSATVTCFFENVPEGGVCGVEYTWSNGSKKQVISNADGPQTITISGLESGTTYSYSAYVEAYGLTYYGEEKSFNTKNEIPNITGVWNCKEFQNGTRTGEATFELKADGAASSTTISGSGGYSRNSTGHWSINDEGHVTIQFSWQGFSGGGWKSYGGTINSFVNPTQIEGTANDTYVGNMGGGGQQFYQFVMTR